MNVLIAATYAVLALASLTIIVLTIRKKHRSKLDGNLLFIAAMMLCWEIFEILFYLVPDPAWARLFFDWKLPFVDLVSLAWFLYVVAFYGMEKIIGKEVVIVLLVIPLFTLCLALTTPDHSMLRSEFIMQQMEPLREYTQERGAWFWLHSAYCYLLVMSSFIVGVTLYRKTPRGYRRPSTLLLVGLGISFVANFAVVFSETLIDLSLVGGSITLVLLYFATKNYQGFAFVIEARREAFHHIEESVFILGGDRSIINMNRSAKKWLDELGIVARKHSFPNIVAQVKSLSEKDVALTDLDNGVDYYFESGKVYNIREKPILDNDGNPLGHFTFVADETDNRELIEYLDKHSGLDALTGLSNRRKNEEDIVFLDREDCYPLAILYGDLNYLKETNDAYGHHQGDVLLRLVAEVLRNGCPPSARIGRVGGDEFVVILPNHTDEQVKKLSQEIKNFLEKEGEPYPFTASIALGYAIKNHPEEDITDIVNAADANMYEDKQRNKQESLESLFR